MRVLNITYFPGWPNLENSHSPKPTGSSLPKGCNTELHGCLATFICFLKSSWPSAVWSSVTTATAVLVQKLVLSSQISPGHDVTVQFLYFYLTSHETFHIIFIMLSPESLCPSSVHDLELSPL